ncbi:MAG: carboxypeptidase-like regulatory domain-containing protein [Acidobacteriota bacterium]|nr:carboxypeptidase-like regulatory domain-containing protein [Acidobacteriota bacterium]
MSVCVAHRAIRARVVLFALVFFAAFALHAQISGTGNIQGTLSDATGAVLPNASVSIVNEATGVKHDAKTDGAGAYSFPNIEIGTYTLTAGAPGFQTYIQTGNVLEVGSNIALNVKMTVGAAEQKMEVHTDSLALQTEDVSFKQTIDQNAVTEMPLNGRQMTGLITLSGGSSPAPGGDFTGSKFSYQTISVSIAGGNGNTTQWRLDGGDNNDYMGNGNLPFPFPDAVSQFSVESTALGATGGSHSGGLVNVVTRSGTNRIHGSGFEFLRNNYINATNFFSTCNPVAPATTCVAKDTLHQNQYGFTFGGPVWIPKLYRGTDKLFFFVGYQFQKTDQSTATTTAHVPTPANMLGDFSQTDPTTKLVNPITGAALVGNQISPSYFNAQALALQKYLPATTDPTGLVGYAIPSLVNDKQFVTRIDYTLNPKNNLYGRYFLDGYQAPAFFLPTNILFTTSPGNVERVQSGTIGENYTISSRTVNTFHVTVLRRVDKRGPAPGINACTIGINLYCALPTGLQITVGTNSSHGFAAYCGTCAPGHFNDNTLAFADDVTMLRGKHQIVFGAEYIRNQLNIVGGYQSNGNFTFNGQYSANGPTGGSAIGDANLDFLTGAMSGFQQSKQQQNALRGPIPSIYAQDTYHATKQLTVVAGIRWQPNFIPVDYFNRGSVFSMSAFLANQVSSVYPTAPAGTFFYGDTGVSRQFTRNAPWQFSPNLGFAYDVAGTGKTVVRAGAELVYDQVNYFTGQRVNQNPPFATASSPGTTGQLSFSSPWTVNGVTSSPYPQPAVPTKAQAFFPAQGQFIVFPDQFHPSYTTQWTASVQQQLGRGWQLQLDYIGNHTTHAPLGRPFNDANFVPGVWGAAGTASCPGVVQTGPGSVLLLAAKYHAPGSNCSQTGNAISRYALTVANPAQGNQYLGGGGGSVIVGDGGWANYNGLVTTVQHRLSSTFSVLANHTWSKCLNVADANGDVTGTPNQDPTNPRLDYGPCGSDYRHIENVVIVAKSGFSFSHRLEGALLNNWEFAPLVHIQSGAPLNVTSGQDNSLTSTGNDRPNLVPGVPIYARVAFQGGKVANASTRQYLNPAAFAQVTASCPGYPNVSAATCPQLGTFGNVGRNSFRGIPSYQVDAQISRIFPLHESLNLDLRLEAFNVLNHPNFYNPNATTGGASASNFSTTSFGQVSTAGAPRIFQAAAKISF